MSTAELSVKSSITFINIAFFHTLYVLMVKDIVICVDITNKQTTILETCIKHNFSYVLVWTQRFLVLWWTKIYSQKNMSIDLEVLLQNECHSIIQPSVWLNFLCKMKCFSKLIKKYSTQQSENVFIVTMQITMETVHIGGIQTGQFGDVYIQTWPPTSPSPGVPVIIGHGNWILGPRITIRRQLSPPHKYWSSLGAMTR